MKTKFNCDCQRCLALRNIAHINRQKNQNYGLQKTLQQEERKAQNKA